MTQAAERYIEGFRRGEGFTSPPADLIASGRPDPQAVERLRRELAHGSPEVREAVVDLLADLAIQTDPSIGQGVVAIRDPQIVSILSDEGCALRDAACAAAMDALRTSTPTHLLSPHATRYAELLDAHPTQSALLLVAKAKAAATWPVLERLAADPAWSGADELRSAQAALGDASAEAALAAALDAAADGPALAAALAPAALAGTPALLRAIGERMRTPLVIDRPGVNVVSLRLHVMDALRYNFPQIPEFYANNVHDDAGYLAIERLLTERLGVVFDTERPGYLKIRGYPIPVE